MQHFLPGGNKILLAAGKDLQPFFNMFAVHKAKHVLEIMESLRIGNVHPEDMKVSFYKGFAIILFQKLADLKKAAIRVSFDKLFYTRTTN